MKRFMQQPYRFGLCWTAILVLCFGFALLDTFVIPHAKRQVTTKNETVGDAAQTAQPGENNNETGYQDDNMEIAIQTLRAHNTTCYIAEVKVSDAAYLRTAFAQNTYGRNIKETTSEIALAQNAILAVNGDYYGARRSGYVVRNGEIYREQKASNETDVLLIDREGTFQALSDRLIDASDLSTQWQVLSFGPTLIQNGQISVDEEDEVGQAMVSNPRTAIGQISQLHYIFLVSDGRTDESTGLSLYQLAEVMGELGCQIAYNLDGGGSSTMVFQGEVINQPTTNGNRISERAVSDIVYIGY